MITDVINVFSCKFVLMVLCCLEYLKELQNSLSAILKCENVFFFFSSLLKLFEN